MRIYIGAIVYPIDYKYIIKEYIFVFPRSTADILSKHILKKWEFYKSKQPTFIFILTKNIDKLRYMKLIL